MLDVSFFDQFNTRGGVPFMDERTKGNLSDVLDREVHIADFAFLTDEDEREYAVFILAEDEEHFYFGNAYITEMLKKTEAAGVHDLISQRAIMFMQMVSRRKGRTYTNFKFC